MWFWWNQPFSQKTDQNALGFPPGNKNARGQFFERKTNPRRCLAKLSITRHQSDLLPRAQIAGDFLLGWHNLAMTAPWRAALLIKTDVHWEKALTGILMFSVKMPSGSDKTIKTPACTLIQFNSIPLCTVTVIKHNKVLLENSQRSLVVVFLFCFFLSQ